MILFGLNAVDELDRTAFGILLPEIRDDVRPRPDDHADLSRGRDDRGPRTAGADRPARRPPAAASADDRRRRLLGAVRRLDGTRDDALGARDRPLRIGDRQGRHRPDAQLVARRLLPVVLAQPRVQHPPRGQRRRCVRRAVGGRPAGLPVRVAAAVHRVRRADAGPRGLRPPAPRTGARALGAGGDGRRRRRRDDRGDAAVVRRELAHRAADPDPAAAVGVAPLPRRQPRRVRRPRLAAVRAGVRSRRAGARHRGGDRRTVPAGRSRRRRPDRHEAIRHRSRRSDPVPVDESRSPPPRARRCSRSHRTSSSRSYSTARSRRCSP